MNGLVKRRAQLAGDSPAKDGLRPRVPPQLAASLLVFRMMPSPHGRLSPAAGKRNGGVVVGEGSPTKWPLSSD